VVVDGDVEVVVANLDGMHLTGAAHFAPVDLPSSVLWNASQLLHIDVDELAGPGSLVADHGAGGPIDKAEPAP
jgi:hypothetical protein